MKNISRKTIFFGAGAAFSMFLAAVCLAHPAQASTFTDSVTALGAANQTMHLSAGTYEVDTDFTIPYNVTLHFDQGAVINVASGATLIMIGAIDDCNYRIFDDANTDLLKGVKIKPGASIVVRPEWWGAKADDNPASAGVNANAIEKAMNSLFTVNSTNAFKNGPQVLLSIGKYYIDRTITMKIGAFLVGQGDIRDYNNVSVLRLKDNSNCLMLTDQNVTGNHYGGGIQNILFHGGSQSLKVNGLEFNHFPHTFLIKGNGFTDFNNFALSLSHGAGQNMIDGNVVKNSYNGMFLSSFDGFARNNDVSFSGDIGIQLTGDFSLVFQGNHISGGSTGKSCLYNGTSYGTNIYGNTMESCDYGMDNLFSVGGVMGGIVKNNTIKNNRLHGVLVERGILSATIENNTITGNGGYGIYLKAGINSKIIKNDLTGNAQGALYVNPGIMSGAQSANKLQEVLLIEDNTGVDMGVGTAFPNLETNNSAPKVTAGKRWKTNNSTATTVTDFGRAPRGKEIYVNVNDSNTTLKFSANKGSEKIVNGDFSSSSGWTFGSGWSYDSSAQAATHTAGSGNFLEQPISNPAIVNGEYYEMTFTISDYQSGYLAPYTGYWGDGGGEYTAHSNGTFTAVMRITNRTPSYFRLIPTNDFAGKVDDVSVKKVDTVLRGFGGVDKKFNSGDQIHCLKGPDTYWYCDDAKLISNVISSADLNADSKIDLTDFNILKSDFLKIFGSFANPKSDINGDGQATIKDAGILMSGWKP